jgi:putative inorganic carbon (hco3(-)) transporter
VKKIITRSLLWIDRWHWLWLLLAAPFLLFPNSRRSLAMLAVPGIWVLSLIVRGFGNNDAHDARPARGISVTPLNSSIWLMALMVLVSTWATYDISMSLPKISGMVLGFGVFYAVTREGSDAKRWWLILILFLCMGFGVAVLGLVGTDWFTSKLGSLFDSAVGSLPRLIAGLPGAESGFHPNEVAGALTWIVPLMLALSVGLLFPIRDNHKLSLRRRSNLESSRARLLRPQIWARNATGAHSVDIKKGWIWPLRLSLWLATLFVTGVFVLTQSRGGYIGLAIATLGMLFFALPRGWRWGILGFVVILGLVLGLTVTEAQTVQIRDWAVGSGLTTDRALSLNTIEGRVEIWSRAIYGLQDFPFTGMGMNTFREVVHVLYPLFLMAPDKDFGHAHNEFLQAGLDLGIPGMIAFMGLYLGAYWMLMRLWIDASGLGKVLLLGLGGGLTAHLLYGITDAVALGAKPGLLFWMLLGLIASLHEQMYVKKNLLATDENNERQATQSLRELS